MNEIYVVYWDLREASDAPWFGGVKIDGPDGICDIDWILSWSIIFVWVCLWLKVFSSYGVAFKAPSSKLVSLVTFLFRLFIIFWLLYSSFDLTLLFFYLSLSRSSDVESRGKLTFNRMAYISSHVYLVYICIKNNK
jgi:hypothetical protein